MVHSTFKYNTLELGEYFEWCFPVMPFAWPVVQGVFDSPDHVFGLKGSGTFDLPSPLAYRSRKLWIPVFTGMTAR